MDQQENHPLPRLVYRCHGPFPKDADGNLFLLVAVDPFSKWVEARPVPSLHSWCAAEFLEDIMH